MKVYENLTEKLELGQEARNFQKELLIETIREILQRAL